MIKTRRRALNALTANSLRRNTTCHSKTSSILTSLAKTTLVWLWLRLRRLIDARLLLTKPELASWQRDGVNNFGISGASAPESDRAISVSKRRAPLSAATLRCPKFTPSFVSPSRLFPLKTTTSSSGTAPVLTQLTVPPGALPVSLSAWTLPYPSARTTPRSPYVMPYTPVTTPSLLGLLFTASTAPAPTEAQFSTPSVPPSSASARSATAESVSMTDTSTDVFDPIIAVHVDGAISLKSRRHFRKPPAVCERCRTPFELCRRDMTKRCCGLLPNVACGDTFVTA